MTEIQTVLDGVRAALALSFLLYSSWSDYKTREVSNTVWMVFAPPAFALTLAELLIYEPSQLLFYGASFGLTTAFAFLLFYSGGFGGADAKALMCLALAMPFYPIQLLFPALGEVSPISRLFFPVTVFSNSALFAALTAIVMLLYNLSVRVKTGTKLFEGDHQKESIGKKILVLITGYKVSINTLKQKWHVYPLEDAQRDVEGNLHRELLVLPKDEGRAQIVERLDSAVKSGRIQDKLWATPGLPMLIFVTAGLIAALFLGDIVWALVRTILR